MKKTMRPAIVTAVCALFLMMACTFMQTTAATDNGGASEGNVQVSWLPMDPYSH
ncbi:MAG: hypothetical protein HFI76_06660 [Lachnospiraceae bacterium]|jgi:hypothetical protein|nr:hypothetical protein [Lachnospiraceae bacterium]